MSTQSQFLSNVIPLIDSGLAPTPITVTQTLGDAGKGEVLLQHTDGAQQVYIQVNGPQTALTQDDIAGVYPAPGSTNSPDNYLPHIALKRRTLPWERTGPMGQKPWLALLLLKNSELQPAAPVRSLNPAPTEFISPSGRVTPAGPVHLVRPGPSVVVGTVADVKPRDLSGYNIIRGTHLDDTATVNLLFVKNSLLAAILPAPNTGPPGDLPLLSVVKRTNSGDGDVDCSIVIGNRLPDAGAGSPELHTAFLVSLEARNDLYDGTRTAYPDGEAGLIVLHSWDFTPSTGGDFEEVMRNIRIEPNGGVLRFGNLPQAPSAAGTAPLTSGFDSLLDQHGLFLEPLQHTQAGNVTYRGPLRPFPTAARSAGFAVRSAPEEFSDATPATPLDYSHAVAFELGKLLAVASHDVLEDLHEMHGVVKIVTPQQVAINRLPIALQKPEWVIDPAWSDEPWSMPLVNDKGAITGVTNIANNAKNFVGATPGDVSGVTAQLNQFANVASTLTGMGTPVLQQIGQINIGTVQAGDLEKQFPVGFSKVQG